MPWIDDVVAHTTIRSTWGNTVRDHAVAVFASVAERDANAAKMIEGALCYTVAERALFVRRAAATNGFGTLFSDWVAYTPTFYAGGGGVLLTVNYAYWRRLGARTAEASWMVTITGFPTSGAVNFTLPTPAAANPTSSRAMIGSGYWQDLQHRVFGHVEVQAENASFAVLIDPATGAAVTSTTGSSPFCKGSVLYEVSDG